MDFDSHEHAADLARLRKLAVTMDSAYRLPVVGVRVGWDAKTRVQYQHSQHASACPASPFSPMAYLGGDC